MYYQSKNIAKALVDLSYETPSQEAKIIKNFLGFCHNKKITNQLSHVIRHLELLAVRYNRRETLTICSAKALDSSALQTIKKLVQADKDTNLVEKINPDLLGGFQAEYHGHSYDGSISNQLITLKNKLKIKN